MALYRMIAQESDVEFGLCEQGVQQPLNENNKQINTYNVKHYCFLFAMSGSKKSTYCFEHVHTQLHYICFYSQLSYQHLLSKLALKQTALTENTVTDILDFPFNVCLAIICYGA